MHHTFLQAGILSGQIAGPVIIFGAMSETIAIIGDGAMATICAGILADNGYTVRLWSAFERNADEMRRTGRNERFLPGATLPGRMEITTNPAEAFIDATMAISAVPTQYTRIVWERLKANCPADLPICSVSKGIEDKTLLRPSQILADVLTGSPDGNLPVAALSGPSIATELIEKLPATVVSASVDEKLAVEVQKLFKTTYFRVYTNTDIIGVEISAATKNIIAIAAGILDGLHSGDNAKAALLTRGLVEITRLGMAMGGRRETFSGLAGLGDLVTTCISPHGRNRSFGEAVGKGQTPDQALAETDSVVEGVATTTGVLELARQHSVEMPITQAVHAVIFESHNPQQAIYDLMSRPLKAED
jgi:glycerol-3-phosphate dehydrogenase (NAD(P)+)